MLLETRERSLYDRLLGNHHPRLGIIHHMKIFTADQCVVQRHPRGTKSPMYQQSKTPQYQLQEQRDNKRSLVR